MELVREALYDTLHEVLLCDLVLAAHHLLHHAPLHNVLQDLDCHFQQGVRSLCLMDSISISAMPTDQKLPQ